MLEYIIYYMYETSPTRGQRRAGGPQLTLPLELTSGAQKQPPLAVLFQLMSSWSRELGEASCFAKGEDDVKGSNPGPPNTVPWDRRPRVLRVLHIRSFLFFFFSFLLRDNKPVSV